MVLQVCHLQLSKIVRHFPIVSLLETSAEMRDFKRKMEKVPEQPGTFFVERRRKGEKCRAVSARSYCFLSFYVLNCDLLRDI